MPRFSLPFLLVILLISASGCPKKEPAAPAVPRVTIGKIKVEITADRSLEQPGLEEKEVLARVKERLGRAPEISLGAPSTGKERPPTPGYRLTLEMALARSAEETGLEGPVAVAAARARIPGDLNAPILHAQAVGPISEKANRARVRQNLLRLLDAVLDDLAFQAGLVVATPARLAAALSRTSDQQRLIAAVEICATRRTAVAVEPLIGLLGHKDQEVVDRVVGALIAIGDRRAVKPLTRLSKLQDTARLAKLLDGIAALGGDEALSFLQFVASGHEDEDIRFMATEALERMKPPGPDVVKP